MSVRYTVFLLFLATAAASVQRKVDDQPNDAEYTVERPAYLLPIVPHLPKFPDIPVTDPSSQYRLSFAEWQYFLKTEQVKFNFRRYDSQWWGPLGQYAHLHMAFLRSELRSCEDVRFILAGNTTLMRAAARMGYKFSLNFGADSKPAETVKNWLVVLDAEIAANGVENDLPQRPFIPPSPENPLKYFNFEAAFEEWLRMTKALRADGGTPPDALRLAAHEILAAKLDERLMAHLEFLKRELRTTPEVILLLEREGQLQARAYLQGVSLKHGVISREEVKKWLGILWLQKREDSEVVDDLQIPEIASPK